MKSAYQQQHSRQLDAILAALPKDADATLRRFVQQFYARAPLDDLEHYGPAHAVALAASAFAFLQERTPGKPKIRIFSPEKREHGYDSKNITVELINNDMPFLVDSLSTELMRHGLIIRETIHPIIRVRRGKDGKLEGIADADKKNSVAESLIHFEVSPLPEDLSIGQLTTDLEWVLDYIRVAVADWKPIVARVASYARNLSKAKTGFERAAISEVKDFLRWLADRNFIFLGYGEYGAPAPGKTAPAKLGILKITDDATPAELEHFQASPPLIEITKSSRRSPLHRPVPMDTVSLKRFDAKGEVVGEVRFLGLFTSNVYYQSAEEIPLLRRKLGEVLARANLDPASHDGKALKSILEFLPRDEVFQMSDDDLFDVGMGVLALESKPGVRVFVRRDAFERFISAMVFVPRERFSTALRYQIQAIIEKAFNATTSTFSTQITEAPLARLHVILKTTPGDIPSVDMKKIEQDIARRAYLWSESLFDALSGRHGERKAGKLQRIYGSAFPQNYINRYDSEQAVHDIGKIEEAVAAAGLALELFAIKAEPGFLHLKIYNPSEEIALSDILPMLENAGFRVIDEHPFLIAAAGAPPVWIRDFKLQATADCMPLETVKPLLENILLKVWRRDMENDRFNALAVRAGLDERQITVLRACACYLRQVGFTYAQPAIEYAMGQQPRIAALLVALFEKRFSPHEKDREAAQKQLQEEIEKLLADVSNVAEDRILRRYVDLVLATVRTNYFQTTDAGAKPALSFKMNSHKVPELPQPVPFAEIFVYSPRVEGIHLRGGKVARGGLRWSDRHDDYRTEVLGLMKAQMVKNSVIVPVGSKGGFVLKQAPSTGGREALMEEGIACYKTYLRALLDLTDNIKDGKVMPPPQLVRHDGDDPYLVVAADKGTATFSDIANSVSAEYGFWLGDAFASGGSAGYDHKKMGITARGAWVSVTRHFREMGVDIASQDFTCVGIGDMAGDVFGNGMLLSKHIKLIAAFNHIHIFLDPSPDSAASFAERQRLFALPRSSWKDYDTKLISKGGGVFDRSAKSITLSREIREALGIHREKLTPDELIRAILLSPVDLLWNGGIGTYVKAEEETNEQVGDRANNAVRVSGRQLRCKVVGEGGNLGFTQKGRIEYARAGGRINTDAIDNSAGVDCSDHEVNIKIAFAQEMAAGKLTLPERDRQLADMTEEVAHLVLTDNVLQTQALSIAERRGAQLLDSQGRLMRALEKQGLLNRQVEFLPGEKQLAELKAAGQGLTRPELAVLLAYSKMELYRALLESTLPDEGYFRSDLVRYFPAAMQDKFAHAITHHHLKREIVATVVTNSLINRAGMTFVFDIAEDLGVGARDITAAYALARDAFDLRTLWDELEAAESSVSSAVPEMQRAAGKFLEQVVVWLLRNLPLPIDIDKASRELLPAVADVEKYRDRWHSQETRQSEEALLARLKEQNVPDDLARRIAGLELVSSAFNIITVAHQANLPIDVVGSAYFDLGERLHFGWLRERADKIVASSYWERLAVQSIVADLYDEQRRLTAAALRHPETGVSGWLEAHQLMLGRYGQLIESLKSGNTVDTSMLMVVLRHIRSLGGSAHA